MKSLLTTSKPSGGFLGEVTTPNAEIGSAGSWSLTSDMSSCKQTEESHQDSGTLTYYIYTKRLNSENKEIKRV